MTSSGHARLEANNITCHYNLEKGNSPREKEMLSRSNECVFGLTVIVSVKSEYTTEAKNDVVQLEFYGNHDYES